MNWQRWNTTTHIFEISTNDGASWAVLPLDASILNQGLVATARLGGGGAAITKYLRGDQNWAVPAFSDVSGVATKAQLPAAIAYEDEANSFSLNQLIYKVRPELQVLDSSGATARGRVFQPAGNSNIISINLSYDGANWNLDDTSKTGWALFLDASGDAAVIYHATAGANPRTVSSFWNIDSAAVTHMFLADLTGGQLSFPNAQNASSNANTLDDYEEGLWTPADASGVGLAFTQQITGQYVKIGQLVLATYGVLYPATASGLGAAITLPFTPQGTQYDGGVFYNTFVAGMSALVNAGAANMSFFNGSTQVSNANMSGKDVRGTAIYRASA